MIVTPVREDMTRDETVYICRRERNQKIDSCAGDSEDAQGLGQGALNRKKIGFGTRGVCRSVVDDNFKMGEVISSVHIFLFRFH